MIIAMIDNIDDCLPVLLYGRDVFQMSASHRHKIVVGLNNTITKFLMHIGVKVLNSFCFTVTRYRLDSLFSRI